MEATAPGACRLDSIARYEALMAVVRARMTNRAFARHEVPREHFEMIRA